MRQKRAETQVSLVGKMTRVHSWSTAIATLCATATWMRGQVVKETAIITTARGSISPSAHSAHCSDPFAESPW